MQAFDDPDKALVDFIDRQKMKRLGTADEIAGAVLFLASKDVSILEILWLNGILNLFLGTVHDRHKPYHGWRMVTVNEHQNHFKYWTGFYSTQYVVLSLYVLKINMY